MRQNNISAHRHYKTTGTKIVGRDMLKTLRNSLLRPFLIVVFLLALEASFTLWSQVGGQSHLDMVYWPWKLAVGLASALLITAISATLARNRGEVTRRALFLTSLLLTVAVAAGLLSYFSHLNEPADDGDDEPEPAVTSLTTRPPAAVDPVRAPGVQHSRSGSHQFPATSSNR